MHQEAQNPIRLLLAVALWSLAATPALSAAPTLTGVILNSATGQPVRGAALAIEGTETNVTSDLDGLVRVELPAGSYSVVVTREGFKAQKITGVEVAAGGGNFAVVLEPAGGAAGSVVAEEITVTAEADIATATALLAERKNAVQISDSIGAVEMSKNTGSDAAGVLSRVTGVSLQDSKYVYVRGLGDRYSSTTLNGAKLPSTELERKVVPLDLFPSSLIEKITVSKSYTADKPGDFAAGLVELSTVDYPARRTAKVELGGGWNSATTGQGSLTYGDGLSFFGDGGQPLSPAIPAAPLVRRSPVTGAGFTPAELEAFGEAVGGVWTPEQRASTPYDRGFKANYGQSAGKLGFVISATYENDWATRDENANYFQLDGQGGVRAQNVYRFDTTNETVRQALTGSFSYRAGINHHLRWRGVSTELADNEARFQEGWFDDISAEIRDFRVSFRHRQIKSFQLGGDHYFDGLGKGGLLEWRYSSSDAATEENRREALYEEIRPDVFRLSDNGQSGFLFYNDLDDQLDDAKADWSSFFGEQGATGSVKAGLAYTASDRRFLGRRLRFFPRGSADIDLSLPPEEIFSPPNIRADGFEIQEVTRPTDTYSGRHDVAAGYVQADVALGKWRLVAGARLEASQQEVVTIDRNSPDLPPVTTVNDDTDLLPALNLTYALSERANLRFSASRTVNRPEFRELAPFKYTHVVGGFAVTGNPELTRAQVTSFDARWELFSSGSEVTAVSLFYKDFTDPIEDVALAGAEPQMTFANVEGARNLGAELELRRDLGRLTEALRGWSVIFNYTYVDSQVTFDPETTVFTNADRALVGQPDNVVNAILEWSQPEWGSVVRLLYNYTGDKVSQAGGFGLPDVIEAGRGTFDLVWGQGFDHGFELKIAGSNLFAEERLWSQGGGVFRLYDPGRSVSFSLAYKPWSR